MADSHTGSRKYIGIGTDDKRAMLRYAWDCAPEAANSLLDQLKSELQKSREIYDDNSGSSASNSHSGSEHQPSTNRATAAEQMRGWNQIIEGFLVTRQYLQDCAAYGQDAFATFCAGYFPSPLPALVVPPVLTDSSGRWARLATFNDIPPNKIVGNAPGDEAIYCWLLDHPNLLNIETGIRESRGDYSMAIIGRGGMQFT